VKLSPNTGAFTDEVNSMKIFKKTFLNKIWKILVTTITNFSDDYGLKLSASLAYYTVFSIAPLLILVIALTSIFLRQSAIDNTLFIQIKEYVGNQAAAEIQDVVKNMQLSGKTHFAIVIGVIILLLGASSMFVEIQDSLNIIWRVRAKPKRGWVKMLTNRFLSFSLIISLGFLLLASLIINLLMNALGAKLQHFLPGITLFILNVINLVITLIVISVLFAIIFKFLPDVKIKWKDVRSGAIFTALLFMLGQYLIGIYLSHSAQASAYGAAGSLILLLVWIYYTSVILYIGAEFTQVYAEANGSRIEPAEYAVSVQQTEVEKVVTSLPAQHPELKGKLKDE
jgi:membrane protein